MIKTKECYWIVNHFFIFFTYWFYRQGGGGSRGTAGRGGERERNIESLFHIFMLSLFVSCMCSDLEQNLHPWHIRTTLQLTELPRQDNWIISYHFKLQHHFNT